MILLVTGASGVGKSTVRTRLLRQLPDSIEAVELASLGEAPQWSLEWRHRMVERLVQRARSLEADARHLLICGDPIPPGEVVAAPSGGTLPLSVLLLDASPDIQRERLAARGDPRTYLEHHIAFAEWMRHHVVHPSHRLDVLIQNGWSEMRWERLQAVNDSAAPWTSRIIETSALDADAVTREVAAWVEETIALRSSPN